ncbi:ROK family transcriptional regulator [Gorillibacterium timonense]|uniref:ROK family transcriptional regulator n=1 Tax=Gorillibacterium timonense TaxID=1689269 RepID=UPI00071DFA61|nr:ROK family protein [Gorillibacterium timonense]
MKQTGDLSLMKKLNKALVLELIRHESPTSRARIAEKTGLTKATVSSLVTELIDANLAYESGAGESRGGRKPVTLLFQEKAGYAIGIDLGTDGMTAVLTDLNGTIVDERRKKNNNRETLSAIAVLGSCIRELMDSAPTSPYGIIGIGIGIPGFSDEAGNVLFAPNLGWENVPLQSLLEQEYNLPIVIENEANVGALGESRYGLAKGTANLVHVSIGAGIGTGILLKGELYRGASGFSGEMGHISIHPDGKPCRCGNVGCWELYASENALVDAARKEYEDPDITLDGLLEKAEQGEELALQLLEEHARYLGVGLINIINSFNPELIILGGRLAAAEKWLSEPLQHFVESRSLPYPRAKLDIRFSQLGDRATVLGAASIAIANFFASPKLSVE